MHSRLVIATFSSFFLLALSGCVISGIAYHDQQEETLRQRILLPQMHPAKKVTSARPVTPEPVPDRPICLEEAIAVALKNNHSLLQAQQDKGIALDEKEIARSLFLPAVTAGYAYAWSNRQQAMINPQQPGLVMYAGERDFQKAEVKIMMTLWDFGRSLGAYNQASLRREIAELLYKRRRQRVVMDVVNAYFNVLRAQREKVIAEESLTQAREHLKTAVRFHKYGVVDLNDVLRARVQVADVKQMLIKAKNAIELCTSTLNSVLGVNVNLPTRVIDDTTIAPFELSLEDCLRLAVEHRPEFEVVHRAISVEQEGIRAAKGGHLPRVYVGANYDWDDDGYRKFASSRGGLHDSNISGEIGIQIDLFSGGRTTAEVRKAKKKLAKAKEQAKEVCDGISLQVKGAFLGIKEAKERIKVTKEARLQAKENLRLMNSKYRQNIVASTDVVDAETLLTRTEQNYYTALYDYIVAIARLENAIGTRIRHMKPAPPDQIHN